MLQKVVPYLNQRIFYGFAVLLEQVFKSPHPLPFFPFKTKFIDPGTQFLLVPLFA